MSSAAPVASPSRRTTPPSSRAAAPRMLSMIGCANSGLTGDEATGAAIVRRALDEPLRWIAQNAGHEGYVVVSKVRGLKPGHGFDAQAGEYVDLVAAGVVDPVKVTRSALQNAASIA